MKPDLVYVVKDGLDNDSLKYSLRSIEAHADGMFGTVWMVGNVLPDWLVGVKRVQVLQRPDPYEDVAAKLAAVCANDEVSDVFVRMHDDHFLMEPLTGWQVYHNGSWVEYLDRNLWLTEGSEFTANNPWFTNVRETAEWVEGRLPGSHVYQTHRPLLWDRRRFGEVLAEYPEGRGLDLDGLYPLAGAGGVGVFANDCKVFLTPDMWRLISERTTPWLSCMDDAFDLGVFGGYMRGVFREPSRWEV